MEKKKSNKGLVVALIIIIVLLLGGLGFGAYKYMSLDKDYSKLKNENKSISEDLNKQKEENEQIKKEVKIADSTSQYKFDLSDIKCSEQSKTSCTKELTVRYDGKNHLIKIISSKIKKSKRMVITHQVNVDGNNFYTIDGGWYYTNLVPESNKNWNFDGYIYVFDYKNLGFVLPKYDVEKLGYNVTVLTSNGQLINTIIAELSYTGITTENSEDLDSITSMKFDGHTMKIWDLDCEDFSKARQIGITIENNKLKFRELKRISNVISGGQGGCKFEKELIS